jgi:hypothetical protein
MPERLIEAGAVVGWSRSTGGGLRQYYCPPHVPRSQRTLGEIFTAVSAFTATAVGATCETCGEALVTGRGEVDDVD